MRDSAYGRRNPKRVAIKGVVLSLVVNGFILFSDYQQHGFISPHDWKQVAISIAVSISIILGLAYVFARLVKAGDTRQDVR